MPWEEGPTTLDCMHCLSRGFENVKLISEVFYTARQGGFKWFHYDDEGLPLAQPRKIPVEGVVRDYKPHTSWVEQEDGTKKKIVGLLSRTRCPHYSCAHNNPIRERARSFRNKKKGERK